MSWTFGGLIIKKDYSDHLESFFNLAGWHGNFTGSNISFVKALSIKDGQAAAGIINKSTVLINEFLPYDCSFTPGDISEYDNKLALASANGTILVFFLDGISVTYGYSVFDKGIRMRRWAVMPGKTLCDEGSLLPFEADIVDDESEPTAPVTPEKRVLQALEYFSGVSFASLLQDETIVLNRMFKN